MQNLYQTSRHKYTNTLQQINKRTKLHNLFKQYETYKTQIYNTQNMINTKAYTKTQTCNTNIHN